MTYVVGTAATAVVVLTVAWAAGRVRRALLPDWWGPPAWLAQAVLGISWVVLVAELLGALRLFASLPLFAVTVSGAAGAGLVARSRGPAPGPAPASTPAPTAAARAELESPRGERLAAAVGAAVVGAQWISHVAAAFNRGMTHPDTLWYHGPFTARFVQSERLFTSSSTGLEGLATTTHTLWPLDSSLVHAVGALAFDGDFLSPLLNLGWAALAVLSAWCIGRRSHGGALAVLGAVVVLSLPAIAGTQPGQAANDVMSAGLCLAAVALLLEARWNPAAVAIAGAAAGLAIGTKLTMAIPIAVLTLAVLARAAYLAFCRYRRDKSVPPVPTKASGMVPALLWCAGLFLTGSFWFVRNWIVVGNPTPWWSIHVGPIQFDAVVHEGEPVGQYLFDGGVWRRHFLPGLSDGFGRVWPLFMVLGLSGATWAIARARRPLHRVAGAAAMLGGFGYLITPKNGELGGAVFVLTIRFLAFTYFVGFALLAVALAEARPAVRRAVSIALLGVVLVNATASQHEGLPAWPREGIAFGVVAGAVLLVLVLRPQLLRPAVLAAVPLVLVGGAFVRPYYLDHRYVDADLDLDHINAALASTRDERIAVFRTEQLYPMFGDDLSNIVTKVAAPPVGDCRSWLTTLDDQGFTLVVLGHGGGFTLDPAPERGWLEDDPATRVIVSDGSSALYRIEGRLDPAGCTP